MASVSPRARARPRPTPVSLSRSPSRWKGWENTVPLCGRYAGPAVGDPQVDLVVVAARGQQYLLTGGTVAHRIGREVGKDPLEQGRVGEHLGQVIRQADADAVALWPDRPGRGG